MPPIQTWRILADTFRATDLLVRRGKLPADYKPEDAIFLYNEVPLSTHERNILGFLLHVWNKYDFPFELSEVEGWDPRHPPPVGTRQAFIGWVTGKTLGRPLRYF
jgi:hypothetical protein